MMNPFFNFQFLERYPGMANLLIHSLTEFQHVILRAYDMLLPRSVLEIGSESGTLSQRLLDLCERDHGKLVVVEPLPAPALVEVAEKNDTIEVVVGTSLAYLEQRGCEADFVLIDGDHNYYTVFNELSLIHEAWQKAPKDGIIFLHDVGFPCARRDQYYNPETIPEHARQAYSYAHGVTLDGVGLIENGGFHGAGAFAWSLKHGGARNGVLTAVEDFLRAHQGYCYRSIDAVFGLGAIAPKGSRAEQIVAELFAGYDNPLVRKLEENRLELYLKVLELQNALDASKAPEKR
jgi:predicted O-methyltransferase YrrM